MMKNCIPSAICWNGARYAWYYSLLLGKAPDGVAVRGDCAAVGGLPAVNAGEADAVVTPASNGRESGALDVPRTIWQRTVPDMGIATEPEQGFV